MGLDQSAFWVIDVEGNGASPPEIVELAMVQIVDGELRERQRHYFIRPETPISPHVTRIHGITNEDVASAPSIDDVADELMRWLDGAAIVGHNVKVEVDILARSLPDWSASKAIDTLRLARLVLPDLTSHSLENVGASLGLTEQARRRSGLGHHSALFDATLTGLVFLELKARATKAGQPELLAEADILGSRQGKLL